MPLIRRLWPTLLASFIGTFVATALGLGLLTPEAAVLARKALGIALILYGILGVSRIRLQVPPRAEPGSARRWARPTARSRPRPACSCSR